MNQTGATEQSEGTAPGIGVNASPGEIDTAKTPIFRRPAARPAVGIGAMALGALALGALAFGALAIGRLAVGKGVFGALRIGRLEIDELVVRKSGFASGLGDSARDD